MELAFKKIKNGKLYNISVIDKANNNLTISFQKIKVNEDGEETVNPSFKAAVDGVAGEGFCDANGIE